jgi:hypothetical protein
VRTVIAAFWQMVVTHAGHKETFRLNVRMRDLADDPEQIAWEGSSFVRSQAEAARSVVG